jgi:hypothetical protein
LHGRQEERNEDSYDGDDDQQFNERESLTTDGVGHNEELLGMRKCDERQIYDIETQYQLRRGF